MMGVICAESRRSPADISLQDALPCRSSLLKFLRLLPAATQESLSPPQKPPCLRCVSPPSLPCASHELRLAPARRSACPTTRKHQQRECTCSWKMHMSSYSYDLRGVLRESSGAAQPSPPVRTIHLSVSTPAVLPPPRQCPDKRAPAESPVTYVPMARARPPLPRLFQVRLRRSPGLLHRRCRGRHGNRRRSRLRRHTREVRRRGSDVSCPRALHCLCAYVCAQLSCCVIRRLPLPPFLGRAHPAS